MVMEFRFAAFTVTTDVPFIPPNEACTVDDPTFLAVPSPLAVIETTLVAEDCHVATPVMSCLLLSEKVAFAVNC